MLYIEALLYICSLMHAYNGKLHRRNKDFTAFVLHGLPILCNEDNSENEPWKFEFLVCVYNVHAVHTLM